MKDSSVDSGRELKTRLATIERFLQDKRYQEALAEIRDFESIRGYKQVSSQQLSQLHYLKACVLRFLGSYHDALDNAIQAFSYVKDINDSKRIAEVQYVLGSIHMSLGNLRNAEIQIRDAQTGFRKESDYRGMINTLNQLAFIESSKGNYSKSVELLYEALGYCDQVKEERCRTILHGELGARFLVMGRWDKAEENLLLNIELNENAGDEINLCRGLLSLGYVYFLKREFRQSSSALEKSLVLIKRNNCVRELAIYHEYEGELELTQGNYEKGKSHYSDAISIGEKIAPDSGIISQTYRLLAEVQIAQKQYDEALLSCEKALKVAESLGERIEIGAIHRALGQIYTAKKDKGKTQENFEKSISILDEIGAKFELGKAYLEAGKSDGFEYFVRLKFLGIAEDLFKELGSVYHQGLVNLAMGHLLYEHQEPERSLLFLDSAGKIFRELSEEKELNQTLDLKKKISFVPPAFSIPLQVTFKDIITRNPEMLSLLDKARLAKDSGYTILLEGETGTGKDLLARAIHFESRFKDQPFVIVNCAAIPKDLVESELFGYKKGAFTGANTDKKGLVEAAAGGTLFLNEIADLPLLTQAKLLGAIEDKQFTQVGDTKPKRVDFRVIAASNQNLEKQVKLGNFREDLYYRLSVIKLVLLPLRDRKDDIPLLVDHFLKKHFEGEEIDCSVIHSKVLNLFNGYHWPGNVRELENEFRRYGSVPGLIEGLNQWDKAANITTDGKLIEMEKAEILDAIKTSDDKVEAARLLGISLATLYRKIKLYELNI